MIVGRRIFTNKRIHKAAWVSLNHIVEKQINHTRISEKFIRLIENVTTKKGNDSASDYHQLVVVKPKLK